MVFSARVVGVLRKMPGLFSISGYEPAAYLAPGVIVTYDQMQYMIDKYLAKYPAYKTLYD